MLSYYAHARSIVLLDGEATGRDVYGNDMQTWTPTTIDGCAWWPTSATEAEPVGAATATTRYRLLMPDGTTHASGRAPSSVDRVLLPGQSGQWQVDGDPVQHQSVITGAVGGILAWLVRVSG